MIFSVILFLVFTSPVLANSFESYQADMQPLFRDPSANRYQKLRQTPVLNPKYRNVYQERFDIIKAVTAKNPNWTDGKWIFASEAFQLGSTYVDEKDHPLALKHFREGEDASRECLKKEKDHPLCKMFLAANIAAASAIRGIISSLRHGKTVFDLWMDVYRSNINYRFTKEVSLQGSVRYALGLFHRLVPNSSVLKWIFGVQGDIRKSVDYHREVVKVDGNSPCGHLMLAASLICKRDDRVDPETRGLLLAAKDMKTLDLNQAICREGSKELLIKPGLACGYTTAKQQEIE